MFHTIKKRVAVSVVLAVALIGLGTATNAQAANGMGFTFKLGGGAAYLFNGGGDIENTRLGVQNYAADWVEPGYTSTFDWKKLSILPDFRFEAILNIGESFGIGLGTSYLGVTSKGDFSLNTDISGSEWWGDWDYTETDAYTQSYKLTAIPISLNFYYFFPMDGMRMYVFAGPSFYFGSFNGDSVETYNEEYSDSSWFYWNEAYTIDGQQTITATTTGTAFGFQGGFGLEIPLSPNFSFGIEAYGRYASFSNFKGDWTVSGHVTEQRYYEPWGWWYTDNYSWSDNGTGNLYYDEWQWGYSGNYYGEMFIDDHPPSGSGIRNARQAKINLNSVGILFSVLIHI